MRILVIGPSWVGDMVLAHSLFQILKQTQPDTIIDVAAPAWTMPLLDRMPEVSGKIAMPFKHGQLVLRERIRFGKSLRASAYDQAILLTNSFKSAILPAAAGIPKRTGYLGELRYGLLNDIRPLDKQALPRTVDRFVNLGLPPGAALPAALPNPRLTADRGRAQATLSRLGHALPTTTIIGLCLGAEYGEAKRWPAEYYAEVANH